ncbi:MAG: hypothetical protein E5W34_00500 [Mesorhizobium sp.]|nr:MAG: hypothetical protein E5W34_00500 [Mesorhizobium sp.]TIU45889.1 MAG: hypothetical protein E5W19_28615 [Mesorhizobium sp.]
MSALRHITFCGKKGICKSTTCLPKRTRALVDLGQKLLIVGCDPKVDSTRPPAMAA